MPETEMPQVSVVVSAYGNTRKVRSLLDALAQQTLPAEKFEAVVVDNDRPGPIRPIQDTV